MPWERRTVEDQRREFAQAALQCNNFSALCREFGIDRHTGYKWKSFNIRWRHITKEKLSANMYRDRKVSFIGILTIGIPDNYG